MELVSRGQAREEAQHLHRFRRLRPGADRGGLHEAGAHRRPWRQRGRHADGGGRQPRAGAVRRHRRRRALRRCAQHHARRGSAADAAGMARMGQPGRQRGGLQDDPVLLALRQRRRQGLSGDLRARRPHRPARDLLGARQMGGAAARHHDRRWPGPHEDQHGGRAWRCRRAVRPPGGGRPDLRLRADGGTRGQASLTPITAGRDMLRGRRFDKASRSGQNKARGFAMLVRRKISSK
ncbi:protein of unknown function [Methylorubrum extorquens]|uniref:Uncharacterized protein n=1 Tax=Methylorubrum extorquens TaxID=408 RepID=A0A2N9AZ27_METEX|nr:protein of unknown function [Methylorubrum extorquens]